MVHLHLPPRPKLSTEEIFADKPKDMDHEFYMPPGRKRGKYTGIRKTKKNQRKNCKYFLTHQL